MTVPMAIVDYIPVILFLFSIIILQHDLYNKMSKGAFSLFAAGTIMIFTAGFLKATWKLLYALNICDFEKLNQMFFPVQALGFALAGIAVICMLCVDQGEGKKYAFGGLTVLTSLLLTEEGPAVFSGTMIFVVIMILGVGGMCIGLAIASARRKKIWGIVLFALAFVFMLGMGYLSSKDFANPAMHWAAEAVNVVGQACFFGGTLLLKKQGFGKDEEV